jgi:hypothetical protein
VRAFRAVGGASALAVLVLAGCQYGFSNPAEQLHPGQVSGRAVSDPLSSGTVVPAAGVSVSLQGSTFDQVTHDTGRFALIPLPVGHHRLMFRQGTELALVRHVEVALGRDGQPEGVSLGDVVLPFAAAVAGSVTETFHPGVVVDEATGQAGSVYFGRFELGGVSLGEHLLKVGLVEAPDQEWVGGPVGFSLGPEAQSAVTRMAVLPVRPATAATGLLRFRVASIAPGITAADAVVTVAEALRGPVAGVPAPDARGDVELTVPEGVYLVSIAPPSTASGVPSPPPATGVVISGETADLGTLYLVASSVTLAAQYLCQEQADCGQRGSCDAGACLGWTPPAVAPARLPLCELRSDYCSPGQACTVGGLPGRCLSPGGGDQACVPCGTACTADGIAALDAGSCR